MESLFDDYGVVKHSDYIYLKHRAANSPLTIAHIRQKLGKVESKTYNKDGKTISERKIYRYLPLVITERDISARKRKVGAEVEIQYPTKTNLKEEWQAWETYSIKNILQDFKDVSEIIGIAWDINPQVSYSIILSCRGNKKEFPVNLLHRKRYYNLVRKAMNKYNLEPYKIRKSRLEDIPELRMGTYETLKDNLNFNDAVLTVLSASLNYDAKKHGHFPGYIKNRLYSSLHDILKSSEHSTTAACEMRRNGEIYNRLGNGSEENKRENYRILNVDLEHSGDEKIIINKNKEEERVRVIDSIHDPNWLGSFLEPLTFKEIKKLLPDSLDKEIFSKYFGEDKTMAQIGKEFGISQPAINKRIRGITKYLKKKITPEDLRRVAEVMIK